MGDIRCKHCNAEFNFGATHDCRDHLAAELAAAKERIAELGRKATVSAHKLHEARDDVHKLAERLISLRTAIGKLADECDALCEYAIAEKLRNLEKQK